MISTLNPKNNVICSSSNRLNFRGDSRTTSSRYACQKTQSKSKPPDGFFHARICRARKPSTGANTRAPLKVHAMDAAQVFDSEFKAKKKVVEKQAGPKLTIGILGFGNFGQFIAKRFIQQGHQVLGHSRRDYSKEADAMGAHFYQHIDDFAEEHPDVVILCSSILSTELVLNSLPLQRLRRATLIVDVLSVKSFPKRLLLKNLPEHFDIVCTHPMFGPESGRGSWEGLTFMYEKVRVHANRKIGRARLSSDERVEAFLNIWDKEGCSMIEMTCEEHDRLAASSQFITHTVGRVLASMDLASTPIDTKGYESLLNLKANTEKDSFELYYGLFMYNQNATDELNKLEMAFDDVKKELFDRLHSLVREELFHGDAPPKLAEKPKMLPEGHETMDDGNKKSKKTVKK